MQTELLYILIDIDTDEFQARQWMTPVEAAQRNNTLRQRREPFRWVPPDDAN